MARDRFLGTLSVLEISLIFILSLRVNFWGVLHKGLYLDRCLVILQRKEMGRGQWVGWEKVGKLKAIGGEIVAATLEA